MVILRVSEVPGDFAPLIFQSNFRASFLKVETQNHHQVFIKLIINSCIFLIKKLLLFLDAEASLNVNLWRQFSILDKWSEISNDHFEINEV